jgi:hypothetical protein
VFGGLRYWVQKLDMIRLNQSYHMMTKANTGFAVVCETDLLGPSDDPWQRPHQPMGDWTSKDSEQ